jgi:hypothetical protein
MQRTVFPEKDAAGPDGWGQGFVVMWLITPGRAEANIRPAVSLSPPPDVSVTPGQAKRERSRGAGL